jgi:cob(I)alamin adenosyltransferase
MHWDSFFLIKEFINDIIKLILIMEKSKIYTKSGDKGSTSLVGGKRISKADHKLDAYGTIDELNAFIGLLTEEIEDDRDKDILLKIQYCLFDAGAYLATEPEKHKEFNITVSPQIVKLLEDEIDRIDAILPPLKHFILPGGYKGNALAHVCRTICRRAEREIYKLNEYEKTEEALLHFINRLSDYLFILARKISFNANKKENIWKNIWK